jgi:hypothetical protein
MTDDKTATNGGSSDNPFGGLTIDLSGGFGGPVAEVTPPGSTPASREGRTKSKVLIIGSS